MARRAKKQSDIEDPEISGSAVRSNGYDPDVVKSFVERVETLKAEERELKDNFKKETLEPLKTDIDAVIAEAEAAGIPKKELKRKLRAREYRRRAEAERDKLTPSEQDRYDNIGLALGDFKDLPLGAAAMSRAGNGASAHA